MAMMAVVSSTPVVRGVSVATVIRIWLGIRVVRSPIVPVGIIIVACRISVIAAWEPKTESHSGNSDGHLSVSTLPGNQSQSAYRQSNQEKLFHRFTSSVCFRSSVCCFARNETARLPLPWNRIRAVVRFQGVRYSRITASGIASLCRQTIDSAHIAECERFGDLHPRAVSDHFRLLAVISAGGCAA